MKKIDKCIIDKCVYLYTIEKKTVPEINKITNVGKKAILKYLKQRGVYNIARDKKMASKGQIDIFENLYQTQKKTIRQIVKSTGFGKRAVTEHLKQRGVYDPKRDQINIKEDQIDILEHWYVNELQTITELHQRTGMTKQTITKYLKQRGVYDLDRDKNKIDYVNCNFFHNIDTEEKAYWLGFFYADGHMHKNTPNITITISSKDDKYLEMFAILFNIKVHHYEFTNKGKLSKMCSVRIWSEEMWNDLANLGVTNRKTYDQEAKVVDKIPEHLMCHFIRGHFDGDGCICLYKKGNSAMFQTLGTLGLLTKLQQYMIKTLHLPITKLGPHHSKVCYHMQYGGIHSIYKIFNFFYKDVTVFLERKKEIFDSFMITYNALKKYRGVFKDIGSISKPWRSATQINKKAAFLGLYKTEIEAAQAYDKFQVQYQEKTDALLRMNFPEQYDQYLKELNKLAA